MARIFYSMAGEGRGHAVRVRVIVDELRRDHQITLFAPGDAYQLLAPVYAGTDVVVHQIPGLYFSYTRGRVNFLQTTLNAGKYVWQMPRLISRLERAIREQQPQLVITDFEPALPRAAQRCGVPFISLNHQHFLVTNDLSSLPWQLRCSALWMDPIVRSYYSGQVETIISSFYFPPLKPWYKNVVKQIGVLLRPSILRAARQRGGFILAYIRKGVFTSVIEALRGCGRRVKLYGFGRRPREGQIEFCEIDESQFPADLAACEAVVSTAGNQLVGEALYLEKPVLAMPEANNFEQYINAHFLKDSGMGDWVELERVTGRDVAAFMERRDEFVARIDPARLNGNPRALEILRSHLPPCPSSRPAAAVV